MSRDSEIALLLKNEKLSFALYELHKFAEERNAYQLANWSNWELRGYPKGYQDVTREQEDETLKYRMLDVDWQDAYGRPAIIAPKLSFIRKLPFWMGVVEVEQYIDTGCEIAYPDFTEKVNRLATQLLTNPKASASAIQNLFGRIRLEALSRLDDYLRKTKSAIASPNPLTLDHSFDVALLTVNEHEFDAVRDAASQITNSEPTRIFGARVYYDLGEIGDARVALVRSEAGSSTVGGSTVTVMQIIHDLKPNYVIAVGILFGVNEDDQNVGEILYSKQLVGYDIQKIATGVGGIETIIPRGDKTTPNPRLLNLVHDAAHQWAKDHQEIKPSPALIVSGEKLLDNIQFRDKLLEQFPEAKGGEMEGTGVYAASRETEVAWIVIKAICDYADGEKGHDKTERQILAAKQAAHFVLFMISLGGFHSK